ncbi:S9 family peptidase [Dyella acidiphila]|uniref:S9 family peptidase n=1 Tax=Dyella acidiphila TaxID=2775866 RepID=A0ABR9G8U4_9GAMM|nr:prolyl oligopeptidase family serine peptidase [Dyella acidiphila]MBE1160472.1 S9 family peptidase [Dyella acidiphila]
MWIARLRALAAACYLLAPAAAIAADAIPVEDFARHASYTEPRLSPDGQYLAVNVENGEDHAVAIYQLSDMSHPRSYLKMPKFQLAANIMWVGSTRLIIEKARMYGSLDRPAYTGEIIATNVDGSHIDAMFSRDWDLESHGSVRQADKGYATVAGRPAKANNHFYMQAYDWRDQDNTWLYDVDAMSGTRHLISQIGVKDLRFVIDPDGKPRYAYGYDKQHKFTVYQQLSNGWAERPKTDGNRFQPIAFSADGQHLYAYVNPDGGPGALTQLNPDGTNQQILAKDDFGTIDRVEWTPGNQPFAAAADTGIPSPIIIDRNEHLTMLYAALSKKFPDDFIHFSSFSEDGTRFVFLVRSDRNPGDYYLFDTQRNAIQKLFSINGNIDRSKLGTRTPMRFTASDGTPLEAILTVPAGASMNDLPMVLLPHGGPFNIADEWFYDRDAQFLASRGYLVLQVNYRGSGGRGPHFVDIGYGKWGTRIQQDLIDGVKWAEAQHFADPKRVCVYGASFGGYSAMMTVIRAPGLFKCAVGYAGIYDLAMMYDKGDIKDNTIGVNYLKEAIGTDTSKLADNSPDKLADKIDVPVLLIHGEADQRAPFEQAKAMRAALDAAHKPYEWLTKPDEGHGFYNEQNNVDMYNHLQAFLAKYIGPGASTN